MGDKALGTIAAIIAGIITVAIVAVIVSKNANTAAVITGSGTALSGVISAAVAPVASNGGGGFGTGGA
jgi:hypothetical protein